MTALIKLSAIARTSPTLWSHMRLCGLRAVLAATPAADRWVLHDPRAWLGSAFHRLMEVTRRGATPAHTESIWNAAIAEAVAAALNHPLDRRFAAPERWPSYFLVRQRAFALAAKLGAPRKPDGAEGRTAQERPGPARGPERRFEARGGRLVGRPDYYDGHTLTEYKSSLPDAAWAGAAEITDSFRRQLRLYAVIIADALGKWPAAGRIVAASGQTLEVKIDPAACNAEADAALAALDALNAALNAGAPPVTWQPPLPQLAHAVHFRSSVLCSGCNSVMAVWRSSPTPRSRESLNVSNRVRTAISTLSISRRNRRASISIGSKPSCCASPFMASWHHRISGPIAVWPADGSGPMAGLAQTSRPWCSPRPACQDWKIRRTTPRRQPRGFEHDGALAKNSAPPEARAAYALTNDGPDQVAGHETRGSDKSCRLRSRFPLPETCCQSSRKSRSGEQASQVGDFCAWLLLAFTPGMQTCIESEIKQRILVGKAKEE